MDDVVDYFLRVFSGIVLRRGYDEADRNTGSMLMRFMVEHTPGSYYSATGLMRDGDFLQVDRFYYVMVRGPVSLTLWDDYEHQRMLTAGMDGKVELGESIQGLEDFGGLFYVERSGDTTVMAVPADTDYRIAWTAEKDGTVECWSFVTGVRASRVFPT